MSVCPNCHKKDKEFFAPLCHNCNEPVGFGEQIAHSLIWTLVPPMIAIFGMWFVIEMCLRV
jgi:hypothetical protein|tara:strand:+ start:723 stop:905 length:183 start_codon:yes stop_codon:yes gene_type:complete